MSIGRNKIERNAIILVVTDVLVKALGLGLTMVVARMLGVEKFGLIAFAYALSAICLVLPDFGFDKLTVRELARRPSRASQLLVNISAVKVALYVPMAGFCALMIFLASRAEDRLFVVLVVFMVAATQQHLFFACSFFRAMQKMQLEALVRIILAVLSLVTGLAVLMAGYGIKSLVVSRVPVSLFCLGLAILFIRRYLGVSLVKPSWRYAKTFVRMSAPLAIFYIFVMAYGSINLTILGFIKGDLATGYYSAAFKIITLFFYIPAGVAGAALPALSKSWKKSILSFNQVYQRSIRYLLVLAIPLAVGVFILGERAIILLFGRDYLQSVAVIRVLALCFLPDFLNYIMSVTLISMNREKAAVVAALAGTFVALLSSFIFIPRWGAVGAAASLVVSLSAVFFFQLCALFRQFRLIATFVTGARAAVAGGLMGLGLVWFNAIGMPLLLLVGLSIIVYSGALLLLGELKFQEVKHGYEFLRDLGKSLFVSRVSHKGLRDTYRRKEETI